MPLPNSKAHKASAAEKPKARAATAQRMGHGRWLRTVMRGALTGRLLESRLHGQELRGQLAAAFAGKKLRIDRLLLVGNGFDLRGFGELGRRLTLSARVSDLSRLLPKAAGTLNAEAWIRYRDSLLSGAADVTGSDLAVAGDRGPPHPAGRARFA